MRRLLRHRSQPIRIQLMSAFGERLEVLVLTHDGAGSALLAGQLETLLRAPAANDGHVSVTYWFHSDHGPRWRRRTLAAPCCDAIHANYATETRAGLAPLMAAGEPGPGRLLIWHGSPGTGRRPPCERSPPSGATGAACITSSTQSVSSVGAPRISRALYSASRTATATDNRSPACSCSGRRRVASHRRHHPRPPVARFGGAIVLPRERSRAGVQSGRREPAKSRSSLATWLRRTPRRTGVRSRGG